MTFNRLNYDDRILDLLVLLGHRYRVGCAQIIQLDGMDKNTKVLNYDRSDIRFNI